MPEFDQVSKTRLLTAISFNDLVELNALMEEGYPVTTAVFGKNKSTALHLALGREGVELITIQELIRLGSSIYVKGSGDRLPLEVAVSNINADSEIIEYLTGLYGDGLTAEQARSVLVSVLQTEYALEEVEDEEGNVYNYRDCMLAAIGRGDLIEENGEGGGVLQAAEDYLNQDHIVRTDGVIGQIEERGERHEVYLLHDTILDPLPMEAINSLQKKKSIQFEVPVNTAEEDSLRELIDGMFKKDIPSNVDAVAPKNMINSFFDWLGVDLTQLAYLVSIASGSGHLPMYHGGFPGGDDFGGPLGGGGIMFNNPLLGANEFIVTMLGNGTLVVADQDHSI